MGLGGKNALPRDRSSGIHPGHVDRMEGAANWPR